MSTYNLNNVAKHFHHHFSTFTTALLLLALLAFSRYAHADKQTTERKPLSFQQAITQAQTLDPWLSGNKHQQQALEALSIAANTLADPQVSIGVANIAADSLSFAQEPMTQFKIGVSQLFPRGDTLALMQQQLASESKQYPYLRQDRKAQVAVTVGTLWLNAYQMQQSIALIEENKSLFSQLIAVAEARYASSLGQAQQQDIIRAELELSRIDDKLVQFSQQKNAYIGQLEQWLAVTAAVEFSRANLTLSPQLPDINLQQKSLVMAPNRHANTALAQNFSQHPSVVALDNKIAAVALEKTLAKQKYQPQWGVNASYGYRGDDAFNNSRADLFSVAVTFDVPLFTENKQDQQLKAAISKTAAVKTEKQLRIRQLLGAFSASKGRLLQLIKRKTLYQEKLLPQFHQQAEIALNAYTNDTGDFGDIVRARIDELNAAIDHLGIVVAQQKLHLELNYVFSKANTGITHEQ
ncbi:MAG: TolC family protein [Cognaticolwellia sp.]